MQGNGNSSNISSNTDEQPNSSNLAYIRGEFLLVNTQEYVSFNTEQKPHSCDQCSKTFVTKRNLVAHLRKHAEEQANTSAYFQKIFARGQLLRNKTQEYSSFNTGQKSSSCDQSSETLSTKKDLITDLCERSEEQPNSSDEFEKICVREPHLVDNTHEYESFNIDQNSSSCGESSETFTAKKNLIAHLCKDIEEQPNSSDNFEKICVKEPLLVENTHESFNTEQKSSSCDQSSEPSTKEKNLILYRRKHTCHYCQRGFRKKHCLVTHLRVHTGERPFSCDHCGNKFAKKSTLKDHLRIHSGEKPFSCDLCEKTFTVSSTLKKHLMTHQRVKPYSCDICGGTFAYKKRLDLHFPCKPVGSKDTNQVQN